ncbi:hypothetical protein niasHS_011973 [Heterodera schachtii]|uniref:Histone RNA hairpin-binding protein RNA-binding domain-containing protein n=2 Tax=Heterodera TaxID=34509 RepID=A0ABD2I8L3_HETSC
MQNALRAKLAELQNSRRIKEEEKEQQKEEPPQKLDFSLFDDSEFANRSWVELIEEEEAAARKTHKAKAATAETTAAAAAPPNASVAAVASSSASPSNKRHNSERKGENMPKAQKFDFSLFDDSDFANRSWVDIIDEEERERSKGTALSTTPSVVSSSAPNKRRHILPTPQKGWAEPNKGWCTDEATLERRDKELQKMKEKPTYKRYLSQIPKFARKKGPHPRTPNKYTNHTRRSWDKQVRLWKLAIYEWAGETPTSSVCGSRCPSECSESGGESPAPLQKKARTLSFGSGGNNNEADNVASIMGHFDLNTLRGCGDETTLVACGVGNAFAVEDESTMKPMPEPNGTAAPSVTGTASADSKTVRGPTDFSDLVVPKREMQQQKTNGAMPSTVKEDDGWVEVKKRPKLEAKKRGRTSNK